jgi:hypothetical protein
MTNLNDTLPDLMRRATENLEPESTDLVERGMRRGVVLRRRRRAVLSLTGTAAVLATAGIIVTGTQVLGGADSPVAGLSTGPAVKQPATPAGALATLRGLAPAGLTQSKPATWGGDGSGMNGASIILDDGKGASLLAVSLSASSQPQRKCLSVQPSNCTVRPDGSVFASETDSPTYREANNPGGVLTTWVELARPDGTKISLSSVNGPQEKDAEHTRAKPLFTAAELTKLAESTAWSFPAPADTTKPSTAAQGKEDPKSYGDGKPAVPLQQTLATLRNLLPKGFEITGARTWGGGKNGFNGAAYVADDGNGKSRVEVLVTIDTPVNVCGDEGLPHCTVLPDGTAVRWIENDPIYPDKRNDAAGVVLNRVEVAYKDGRFIAVSSLNALQEKGATHTRPEPILTAAQLKVMAQSKAWKFPGTGPVK